MEVCRFEDNVAEVAAEHDIELQESESPGGSAARESAFRAALGPMPGPLVTTIASAVRKRPRPSTDHSNDDNYTISMPARELRHAVRIGSHFTERLLESLLAKNADALQGLNASYMQQCW